MKINHYTYHKEHILPPRQASKDMHSIIRSIYSLYTDPLERAEQLLDYILRGQLHNLPFEKKHELIREFMSCMQTGQLNFTSKGTKNHITCGKFTITI